MWAQHTDIVSAGGLAYSRLRHAGALSSASQANREFCVCGAVHAAGNFSLDDYKTWALATVASYPFGYLVGEAPINSGIRQVHARAMTCTQGFPWPWARPPCGTGIF